MSDLAKDLLTQYYGLGAETRGLRFLSIHESVENLKKEEQKQVIEQTSLTIHEENVPEEESQGIEDGDKFSTTNELIRRPSRVKLNSTDDDYDPDEIFDVLNIDFGPNFMCDVFENEPSTQREELLYGITQNTPRSTIGNQENTDAKDSNENNVNLKSIEDNIPNDVSEGSCKEIKKSPESTKNSIHLPQLAPKREPVCNQTFADFSNTGLKQFPNEISINFPYLRMLYLSDNDLTELSDEVFSTLNYLEWLDVRNNKLSSLPVTIKWHPCLETILLQGNKLESLPLELCTLPNLNTLQVTQNPLITPSEDIIASGSSSILEYLRIEWNNAHPEERIEPKKNKIEPKLSTILCYQSPRKNKKRTMPAKDTYRNRIISTRERRKSYKPSNRCENKGANVSMENRILWHSKAKEFLAKQASIVQRMKDEDVLKDWRRDRKSYSKAMEKAMKRNEDDIPFGFDLEDYASIFKQRPKLKNLGLRKKNKEKYRPPADVNKKINELLESLNKLEITTEAQTTPRSKQHFLKDEIEKILQFQSEIQNLQKYNEVAMVPLKN